jgi:hypothetical protein
MERLHAQKELDEALSSIALGMPGRNEAVKDRPFSAEAVTETSTVSGVGQRTNHKNVTKIDRDREGRTRREQTVEAIASSLPITPHKIIFIFDPVKARSFVVDPKEQVAREFLVSSHGTHFGDNEAQDGGSQKRASVTIESLGQKRIGNLLCTGTRKSSLSSAQGKASKAVGQITTETWSSVDLGVIVDSWTRDPQFGSVHYFLLGVSRKDPSPELFVPPMNYKFEQIRNAN